MQVKKNNFVPALLIIMLVLTGILFIYINKKLGKPSTLLQIPFDYTVSRISNSEVVLNGQNGELILTKDISITVLKGAPGNSTPADFSALAAGQKIKLEAVPGQSATLYILP